MIIWINFIIYLVVSYITLWMYYRLLTLKKSLTFACAVTFLALFPFAILKFFQLVGPTGDLILQLVNNVLVIIVSVFLTKDKLIKQIGCWLLVLMIFVSSSCLFVIMPTNNYNPHSVSVTIVYLITIPYILFAYYIVCIFYQKRASLIISWRGLSLIASTIIFVDLEVTIFNRESIILINRLSLTPVFVIVGALPLILLLIADLIGRNIQFKHDKEMVALKLSQERQCYQDLFEQNNNLAKIRHDIADQIYIAKSIMDEDPDRAYALIKELGNRLDNNSLLERE